MKKSLLFALTFVASFSFGQEKRPTHLDSSETAGRFTDEVIQKLNINYPIFRVFEFKDKLGTHELVVTEHQISDKYNDSIKAYCFLIENGNKILEWQLTDFIVNSETNPGETSIWFWTKYLRLEDIDNDGNIDPIIVYGTQGQDGISDGRLKILLYLNGVKHGIRHNNSSLDIERNTEIDRSYYNLSPRIQLFFRELMQLIHESGNTIFPAGWEEKMKSKKLYFDEN
jgi:hypothetical protein